MSVNELMVMVKDLEDVQLKFLFYCVQLEIDWREEE